MKPTCIFWMLICFVQITSAQSEKISPNIFIITIDGFRWQEIFNGPDPILMGNPAYVKDTSLLLDQYGGSTRELRREKLMPFLWATIARRGQLYGNRNYNNKADVKNFYKISYSGYNELFTGYADPKFVPNTPRTNTNINLPGYLNTIAPYKDKCVAFSSWNIFPFILNEGQNNLNVNGGYESTEETDSALSTINEVQDSIHDKKSCRYDLLTFLMAKQYMQEHHPKVMILGFGETDEFAHSGRYDMYLQKVNDIDRMIAELWYDVQTDPFYKGNTTFIITTDHGRGRKNNTWPGHHLFISGSGEIWLALLGRGIEAIGELKTPGQIYQNQIAQTIAALLGLPFETSHATGAAIHFSTTVRTDVEVNRIVLVK